MERSAVVRKAARASAGFVLLVAGDAAAEPWAAASGLHGGGLGLKKDTTLRLWTDTALYVNEEVYLSPLFGFALSVLPSVELDLVLPVAAATGAGGGTLLASPFVGVSYIKHGPELRLKFGGGIGLPTLEYGRTDYREIGGAIGTRAWQESWFWFTDALPFVLPLHLEAPIGTPVSFLGDAALVVIVPVLDRLAAEILLQFAPGLAIHASSALAIGARLPVAVIPTEDGDNAQFALEPFVRIASDPVFGSIRFTMPLDEPLGFAFDEDKLWGLHCGFGGVL